jgi:hypothetical protein
MAREDWQDQDGERRKVDAHDRNDFGQADYSTDYGYDPQRGGGYRRYSADERDYRRRIDEGDYRPASQPRTWVDRAGAFFSSGTRPPQQEAPAPRRRGPSDRVLWAVIVERLEDERGLDLRGVEVVVQDAEVTLNGRVQHKVDRRRIEDVADIEGVRHVQNNLRVHDHGHWTFL